MEEWTGLEAVRIYLWDYLLRHYRHGDKISFESAYRSLKWDCHHVFGRDFLNTRHLSYDEHCSMARRELELHDSEVREILEELLLKMSKKQAKDNINRVTAAAILNPLLDRAGFEYYIEYQRTGVKINVRLLPKRKAQLYLSYAKVRNESDKLVDMILSIKRMYSYFGHSSGIVNIPDDEEELFDKK